MMNEEDLERFRQKFPALFSAIVDKVERNFFDETSIRYEAARLDQYPVVFVCFFTGWEDQTQDIPLDAVPTVNVAKGEAEVMRFARGEIDTLTDFGAVYATNESAAIALRNALIERGRKSFSVVT